MKSSDAPAVTTMVDHGPPGDDVLAMMANTSSPAHVMPLGIGRLDAMMGDALSRGSLVVLAGGPRAGKTAIGCWAVRTLLTAGERVVVLARDKNANQWPRRIAALDGVIDTDDAIANYVRTKYPLLTVTRASVERAIAILGPLGVLVIDSAQTMKVDSTPRGPSDREYVEEAIRHVVDDAIQSGALIIMLSEETRGASGLRAGRHTSSIEYAAIAYVSLTRDKQGRICWTLEKAPNANEGECGAMALADDGTITDATGATKVDDPPSKPKRKVGKRSPSNKPALSDAQMRTKVLDVIRRNDGILPTTVADTIPRNRSRSFKTIKTLLEQQTITTDAAGGLHAS
jgi:hypothetical protein